LNSHKLYVASNNANKLSEFAHFFESYNLEINLVPSPISLKSVEDGLTLEENAFKKALHLYNAGFYPVFSDDTGLFLPYLDGIPGVRSSRFAGENASYEENRKKLINTVKDLPFEHRFAYFKTVICYINSSGAIKFFVGYAHGYILTEERGDNNFGYDPVFLYPPLGKTFGELPLYIKNRISHRAKALLKFAEFLKNEGLSL